MLDLSKQRGHVVAADQDVLQLHLIQVMPKLEFWASHIRVDHLTSVDVFQALQSVPARLLLRDLFLFSRSTLWSVAGSSKASCEASCQAQWHWLLRHIRRKVHPQQRLWRLSGRHSGLRAPDQILGPVLEVMQELKKQLSPEPRRLNIIYQLL